MAELREERLLKRIVESLFVTFECVLHSIDGLCVFGVQYGLFGNLVDVAHVQFELNRIDEIRQLCAALRGIFSESVGQYGL